MRIGKIIRTVRRLKRSQVYFQIIKRIWKPKFQQYTIEIQENLTFASVPWIKKNKCLEYDNLYFLNIPGNFREWNDTSKGMLWAYNLNYMDYLNQPDFDVAECKRWIKRFITDVPGNKVGLDPYPTALRNINWVKWLSINSAQLDIIERRQIENSLYSQYILLSRKLEYYLLGNHLLEDAFSLTIGALYFSDRELWRKGIKLMECQLKEQILPDGSHYEQSPMYHCILLDRLLDVYNFSIHNKRFDKSQEKLDDIMRLTAQKMLGHLESIMWNDKTIPLVNDSAIGIAPNPVEIFEYAVRLGLEWHALSLKESGYRKLLNKRMEVIVDIGNITASYQPGHTHADTFSFELKVSGRFWVTDTGVSTYDKTARRQYERSTAAHNTVTINDDDSSEVWGGFRVGKRAKVSILSEGERVIEARHDGYKPVIHTRKFEISDNELIVHDKISSGRGVCRIHLASGVEVFWNNNDVIGTSLGDIQLKNASEVIISKGFISREYNSFISINVVEINFTDTLITQFIPL